VVTDDYNITGYTDVDGKSIMAAEGPDEPESVVDIGPPGSTPFYDFYAPKSSTPPDFHDRPQRPDAPAANPTINWSAQLFLVSQTPAADAVTVYGGLEWGWEATYSAKRSTLPRRVIIYDVSASGTTLWGQMTVTGWMGGGSYDFTVEEGGPTGEIYNFNNGTGLTEPSQLPPPPCYTYPCNVTGPYTAQLTPTGNPSSGIISFGFEDQGETFSATGTLTPVTSATGTLDLVTTGVTAGSRRPRLGR
jgi:hypothetical protein